MSNHKREGFLSGGGYYLTLFLCAAAIAVTGYLYYRNGNAEDALQEQSQVQAEGTERKEQDVVVIATTPQASQPQPTQPKQETEEKVLKTTSPVSGQSVFGYSMEALSYNQTTRDWRVHNGIDLSAEAGTQVVAAADGTVYTTYEDEALGHTVVIRHAGGYTTKYSSLSEDLSVKAGDVVSMGDVIGTVDCTALVETTLGPHVHFSVTYQEEPMDPEEFLNLG